MITLTAELGSAVFKLSEIFGLLAASSGEAMSNAPSRKAAKELRQPERFAWYISVAGNWAFTFTLLENDASPNSIAGPERLGVLTPVAYLSENRYRLISGPWYGPPFFIGPPYFFHQQPRKLRTMRVHGRRPSHYGERARGCHDVCVFLH